MLFEKIYPLFSTTSQSLYNFNFIQAIQSKILSSNSLLHFFLFNILLIILMPS